MPRETDMIGTLHEMRNRVRIIWIFVYSNLEFIDKSSTIFISTLGLIPIDLRSHGAHITSL